MIRIEKTASGCTFDVRVTPKARKPSIGGEHDGALKISVTAPPEDGKANAAVIAALAKRIGTSKSNISILRGQTSRVKTIHVCGIELSIVTAAVNNIS